MQPSVRPRCRVISRRIAPGAGGGRLRGFTLLEILVVLLIAGLLASIALPGMRQMVAGIGLAGERKALMGQLEDLGYKAYAEGRPITLKDLPDPAASPGARAEIEVPQGWRLQVEKPILYAVNGACGGGKIAIIAPDKRSEQYLLKPPLCRLDRET